MEVERRYEMLYGGQLQELIADKALAWVPLGILEKHSDHLPWGLDTLKAHGICMFLAKRLGGIVLPGVYVAGVHEAWDNDPQRNRQLQAQVGDFYLGQSTLEMLLGDIIAGLSNIGFKMIVLYSGHYPPLQERLLRQVADQAEKQHSVHVVPFSEPALFGVGDHAGKWETSLYMALAGEVKLEAIRDDVEGQWGHWHSNNPREASREFGQQALEAILKHFQSVVDGAFAPNESETRQEQKGSSGG